MTKEDADSALARLTRSLKMADLKCAHERAPVLAFACNTAAAAVIVSGGCGATRPCEASCFALR
jgi:hypothetical protein